MVDKFTSSKARYFARFKAQSMTALVQFHNTMTNYVLQALYDLRVTLQQSPERGQQNSARDVFGALILSCVLAILTVNRFAPQYLVADTVLYSIISLQHVTLFYWGQNRVIDLFPWALSWITNAQVNLAAHLFLFSFSFFALLCLIGLAGAEILLPEASRRDRWTATIVLLTITLVIMQPPAIHNFTAQGEPYAASYLFAFFAAIRLARPIRARRAVVSTVCLLIAIGLNPSVALLTMMLSGLGASLGNRFGGALLAVVTVAGLATWRALSHFAPAYPVPYTGLDLEDLGTAMAATLTSMASATRLLVIAALFGLLALLASLRVTRVANPLVRLAVTSFLVFAVVWWIGWSANTWVKTNGYPYRYFFPVLLIVPVSITLQLFCYLPRSRRLKDFCAAACMGLITVYLVRPAVPLADYRVFSTVAPFSEYAQSHRIRFFTGLYWIVWPTVFRLLDQPDAAFGLTARADGNIAKMRKAVEEEIAVNGTAKALCLESDETECLQDAGFYSGRRWSVTGDVCPGGRCSVIETQTTADK
jgi:hypothetical protein